MLTDLRVVLWAEGAAPHLARRTERAVRRLGITTIAIADGPDALRTLLVDARGAWLVRAGAVPSGSPRRPPRSATGRSLVAFGLTEGENAFREAVLARGSDLGELPLDPERHHVDSVFVEDGRSLADVLEQPWTGDALDVVSLRAARRSSARAVRIAGFDVVMDRRTHVGLVVTTLHRGGAEQVVLSLHRHLRALGHDVTLFVTDEAQRSRFEAPRETVFLHPLAKHRGERIDRLADQARATGIDVLGVHLLDGEEIERLDAAGIPMVVTAHNDREGWPRGLADVRSASLALLVGCSLDVSAALERHAGGAPVRTAWNGIEPRRAPPASGQRAAMRQELGVRPEQTLVLVVANHRPQKRLERLPAVLEALVAAGTDARLVIVGEPVRADPASLAVAPAVTADARARDVQGRLLFAGARADADVFYAAADVVLSLSDFEGLSLVHLEAVQAGVPLVTTAVSGTRELEALHAAVTVVPSGADASVVARAVQEAASSRPSSAALAPSFGADAMARRYQDLFARVLARSSGAREGILLVTNNFSTGGAQSSARRLLVELHRAGVTVQAAVLEEQLDFPTPGRVALTAAGIDVLVAPRAGSVDPSVTARAVLDRVDRTRPAAVIFWNVIPEHKVLIADQLLDTPVWDVSPGEMYFASFERYWSRPRVGLPYLTDRDYAARLAGVVVKYRAEAERARRVLGHEPAVIANGVEPAATRAVERRPRQRVTIGTLARLHPDKKLDELIAAVRHAARHSNDFEVHVAGAPERGLEAHAEALREASRDLPIVWRGELPSAPFLESLDFFVMISEPSGCPNASLEAMAAGLAVVATDVGGAAEQILHGRTGLVTPRGDARALGEALLALAASPGKRAEMGRAAAHRARTRYSAHRMADDYARLCLGRALAPESDLAEGGLGAEAPHDADRLQEDLPAHLGRSRGAVDEHDGDLLDPHALAERAVGHLDLEGVAVGVDGIDVDRVQGTT